MNTKDTMLNRVSKYVIFFALGIIMDRYSTESASTLLNTSVVFLAVVFAVNLIFPKPRKRRKTR